MWSSVPEAAGGSRAALALLVFGVMLACDSTAAPDADSTASSEGTTAVLDVSRSAERDGERGGAELPQDIGPEPTEEVTEDPAAPYLPVPTGPLGGVRPAKITLPDDYDPAVPWPLVMLIHGYGVDGYLQDYYLGVGEQVDARDFIFILPDGLKDSTGMGYWNAVPGCCDKDGSGVDDLGYLVGLVEEAMSKYHVDGSRVVLMGHSNGGYMSHRLACERADLFTAIASIAGTSHLDMDLSCVASEPVSVLQIHGTLDAVVDYDAPFAGVGALETTEWWAARNACSTGALLDDRDYDEMLFGDETDVTSWSPCEAATSVELWKMVGTVHIPLFTETFTPDVLGFLLGHPRP